MTYDREEHREALAWLEQQDGKERMISESSEDQIVGDDLLRLVKAFYAAGATEVQVYGLTIEDDFEDGSGLEIILPSDKSARAALFAIQAQVLRDIDTAFHPDEERGQPSIGIAW